MYRVAGTRSGEACSPRPVPAPHLPSPVEGAGGVGGRGDAPALTLEAAAARPEEEGGLNSGPTSGISVRGHLLTEQPEAIAYWGYCLYLLLLNRAHTFVPFCYLL